MVCVADSGPADAAVSPGVSREPYVLRPLHRGGLAVGDPLPADTRARASASGELRRAMDAQGRYRYSRNAFPSVLFVLGE